ncbi:type II toxin-antitoxin system HicA family toxin [Pseudomonas saponiphila]|uniref:type II toxin-antitoxin system HicA family toxin n=1 Tax=Pseudomonas saponiphila TaxID=556534 RepID=UPI0039060D8E
MSGISVFAEGTPKRLVTPLATLYIPLRRSGPRPDLAVRISMSTPKYSFMERHCHGSATFHLFHLRPPRRLHQPTSTVARPADLRRPAHPRRPGHAGQPYRHDQPPRRSPRPAALLQRGDPDVARRLRCIACKGSHFKVTAPNGNKTTFADHGSKEMPEPTRRAIIRQLGL